ncbi:Latrophilin/CL-1-like GPS domain protein [Trichuris suis]|nr:Latrophilin/CL-1-like GPS domain protein [Trichuris suis]
MRVKDTIQMSQCDGDEFVHEGSCYRLFGTKTTWDEARHSCIRRNSDLAVITTREKRDFIAFITRKHVGGYADLSMYTGEAQLVWIAGKNVIRNSVSNWFWVRQDSEQKMKESDHAFWEPGHPNNRLNDGCVALSSESAYGVFRSVECSTEAMHICERPEPEQIRHQQSYMYQCRCMPGFSGLNCEFSTGANASSESSSSSSSTEEVNRVKQVQNVPLICGEQSLEISCDPVGRVEMRIAVDYAFFGALSRENAHTETYCPGQSKEKECFAENSLLLLSHYCHGRRKCTLPQLNRLFATHPCLPKSYGYKMEYRYRCVGGTTRCHHRTFEHDGTCLKLFLDGKLKMLSWADARRHCLSSGGDLAGPFRKDIESTLSNAMIQAKANDALMWTGLRINNRSDKPFEFIWTNNMEFDDTKMEFNWQPTTSGCVAIEASCRKNRRHCTVRLIVRDCKESLHWICQYSKRALDHVSLHAELTDGSSSSEEDSDEETRGQSCAATYSRNVYWPVTSVGSTVRRPCPPGTTGVALWKCINYKGKARYAPEVPDMSGCSQLWFNHIRHEIDSKDPAMDIVQSLGANIVETKSLYGGDIKQSIITVLNLSTLQYDQLSHGKTLNNEEKSSNAEFFTKNATAIYNRLLETDILPVWKDLPKEQLGVTASSMMKNLETVASHMGSFIEKERQFTFVLSNIDMKIQISGISPLVAQRGKRDTNFVDESEVATFSSSSKLSAISLPIASVQQAVNSRTVNVFKGLPDEDAEENVDRLLLGFFVYRRGIGDLLKPQIYDVNGTNASSLEEPSVNETIVNSEVVSATVNERFGAVQLTGGAPVVLTLRHLTTVDVENPRCVYWDLKVNRWDTHGCQLLNTTKNYSVCACSHLTSFAIMMDVTDKWSQMPASAHWLMNVMTVVACALSCISLMLSLVAFSCIRAFWSVRNTIHVNLCLCLLTGQLLFVFGIDKTANAAVCSAIAVLLHFSFLSAFCWMLAEGYQLYLMLVKVFECERSFNLLLHLLAYGVPSLIVSVSASLRWSHYGTAQYCWIDLSTSTMWSFVGPVVLVISVNVIVLFLALRTVFAITAAQKKSSVSAIYGWLKGSAMLLCLLGVTWGIGLFIAVEPTGSILSYVFIVLNASQGIFILVFHVLMNEKGRRKLSKVFAKYISCLSWKSYKAFGSFTCPSRSKKSSSQKDSSSTFFSDLPVPSAKSDDKPVQRDANVRIRSKANDANAIDELRVSEERSS